MEVFKGRAHLPGTDKEWNLQLEIDWEQQEANLNIEEAPGGLARTGSADLRPDG